MTASLAASVLGELADDLARGDHRGPARAAGQDALLAGQPARHRERVAVADADPAVDDRGVVRAGHEVLADALGQVRAGGVAGQDAAFGVGADDLDGRVAGLQGAGRAGDRAAGPDAGDEVGDPTLGLVPDLRPGRLLVGRRVLLVPVLVGLERARDVTRQAGRHRVVALGRLGRDVGRAQDDLGAVGPKELLLLGRLLVGHDEDAAIALQRGRDREAVAGVAAGGLDDRAAGLQEARPLGGLDHRQADPVLDRAARIEHLELREQQRLALERAQVAHDPRDPDERGPTDQVQDRLGVLHPARGYRAGSVGASEAARGTGRGRVRVGAGAGSTGWSAPPRLRLAGSVGRTCEFSATVTSHARRARGAGTGRAGPRHARDAAPDRAARGSPSTSTMCRPESPWTSTIDGSVCQALVSNLAKRLVHCARIAARPSNGGRTAAAASIVREPAPPALRHPRPRTPDRTPRAPRGPSPRRRQKPCGR